MTASLVHCQPAAQHEQEVALQWPVFLKKINASAKCFLLPPLQCGQILSRFGVRDHFAWEKQLCCWHCPTWDPKHQRAGSTTINEPLWT